MKSFSLFATLAACAAFTVLPLSAEEHANHDHNAKAPAEAVAGQLVPVDGKTDAAWLAKARADYPLQTCVVSEEKLGGSMGQPMEFIQKQAGKPDQLVRFCCKSCVDDFTKDTGKYLKAINDAAAAKAKAPAAGK